MEYSPEQFKQSVSPTDKEQPPEQLSDADMDRYLVDQSGQMEKESSPYETMKAEYADALRGAHWKVREAVLDWLRDDSHFVANTAEWFDGEGDYVTGKSSSHADALMSELSGSLHIGSRSFNTWSTHNAGSTSIEPFTVILEALQSGSAEEAKERLNQIAGAFRSH